MSSDSSSRTWPLAMAALGVVYGDLGTSPLYTMQVIFGGEFHPVPMTPDNILGILSILFWSLMIVVTMKYVLFIMRADNRGEGGIMALIALVRQCLPGKSSWLIPLGLFGASLFYGDSILTPAISVLSAIEGLEIATPSMTPYVLPISLVVLFALFAIQKRGTGHVGRLFGPVMVIWFITIAILGVVNIAKAPQILAGLDPRYGVRFLCGHPLLGFLSLGGTALALTGAEALYADMGHFGKRPVQLAWLWVVLPGLIPSYFGQGALLLLDPKTVANPFFLMAPHWALYPLVILSTFATVIASQAVISGAYSLTQQAIQLGYLPRMEIQHTSGEEKGQIYLPTLNWALAVAVAALVLGFGSSSALAAAFGLAVTGTMAITTLLAYVVVRHGWHWRLLPSLLVVGGFLCVDLAYFSAGLVKIKQGGWFPLAMGAMVFVLITTWKRGRRLLAERLKQDQFPLQAFIDQVPGMGVPIVPRTAVFLTAHPDLTPHALLHALKHFQCLHERIVILTVDMEETPYIKMENRITVTPINAQFFLVRVCFGFMDETDIPATLEQAEGLGLPLDAMTTSFFLGRETLLPVVHSEMPFWREQLFIAMYRNAGSAAAYFRLPPNRVVELGSQVVL